MKDDSANQPQLRVRLQNIGAAHARITSYSLGTMEKKTASGSLVLLTDVLVAAGRKTILNVPFSSELIAKAEQEAKSGDYEELALTLQIGYSDLADDHRLRLTVWLGSVTPTESWRVEATPRS
jgi:hypothetical protein